MAAADGTLPRPRRLEPRRLLLRHPELGAAAVVACAWVTLLVLAGRAAPTDPTSGMAGMGMPGAAGPKTAWAADLPAWVLMMIAMMGPAALAGVRHTGLNSLRWRRRRAMAEFSAAYLAVWTAFGVLAVSAAAVLPDVPGPGPLAIVLVAAAVWQLSPFKRSALRACHRSVPLPPRGWAAEKAALRFGMRNGLSCLGSCWCLMLVMVAAPAGQLLWTAGVAAVVTTEKLLKKPRRATRLAAAALGIAAAASAATGNLFR